VHEEWTKCGFYWSCIERYGRAEVVCLGVLDLYVETMMRGWDSYVPGGIRVSVMGLDRGGISRLTCWGCPGMTKLYKWRSAWV
jgi:hypothetical protein